MTRVPMLAAAAVLAGVAVGVVATHLGGDAVRAVDTAAVPQQAAAEPRPAATTTGAKRKVALPSPAKRRAPDCRNDEQSDSPSDNRDPALSGSDCRSKTADENDPSGSDGPGPADETGPDEAAGPDDGGNGP